MLCLNSSTGDNTAAAIFFSKLFPGPHFGLNLPQKIGLYFRCIHVLCSVLHQIVTKKIPTYYLVLECFTLFLGTPLYTTDLISLAFIAYLVYAFYRFLRDIKGHILPCFFEVGGQAGQALFWVKIHNFFHTCRPNPFIYISEIYRVNKSWTHIHTDAWLEGQSENIIPLATTNGGQRHKNQPDTVYIRCHIFCLMMQCICWHSL